MRVGLKERLTHRVTTLSGGEQQRVAVARALVLEPEVLLADEPTGNLDPKSGARVQELILELNRERGLTSVIVTHNLEMAQALDRQHYPDGRQGRGYAGRIRCYNGSYVLVLLVVNGLWPTRPWRRKQEVVLKKVAVFPFTVTSREPLETLGDKVRQDIRGTPQIRRLLPGFPGGPA